MKLYIQLPKSKRKIQFRSDYEDKPAEPELEEKKSLSKQLEILINKNSAENASNTPDYILAAYLLKCLEAFNCATNMRDESKR